MSNSRPDFPETSSIIQSMILVPQLLNEIDTDPKSRSAVAVVCRDIGSEITSMSLTRLTSFYSTTEQTTLVRSSQYRGANLRAFALFNGWPENYCCSSASDVDYRSRSCL